MTPADAIFLCTAAAVLCGAAAAVFLTNVYHNAMGLGLALFGIAALYLFLDAEFLAAMQVIIYVGAIAVAILFAIMLSRPLSLPQEKTPRPRTLRAAAAAAALFAAVCAIVLRAPWTASAETGGVSVAELGRRLLGESLLPFEAVSVLLLVAIVGAIVVSRQEEGR